ncbi:unnamed protein product [Rhizophagus irregularis]|nr:unnamed protein product [Rhizophagus irregularis]
MGIYSPRVLIGLKVRTLLSSLCKTMVDIIVRTLLEDHDGLTMEDIIVRALLEDHDGPHHGGHYCPQHYWRTMMVLTMEDIIVRALLEEHDGPHHGGHYCPRIIGGP